MEPVSHAYEAIGPLYSIYVGSGSSGLITAEERNVIIELCRDVFDSFTITEARGFFKGTEEESIVIHVATTHGEQIHNLAARIARAHGQVSVGVEKPDPNRCGTIYGRVRPM